MAVPKKKQSKTKRKNRIANWKKKAQKVARNSFSRANSVLKEGSSFIFDLKKLKLDEKKKKTKDNDARMIDEKNTTESKTGKLESPINNLGTQDDSSIIEKEPKNNNNESSDR